MSKDAFECEKFFANHRKEIKSLQEQFKIVFQDFHIMQPSIDLFADSLTVAVSEQPGEMQLEFFSPTPSFRRGATRGGLNFGNCYQSPDFPSFALLMLSMFGITFICESSFLTTIHITSKRETG